MNNQYIEFNKHPYLAGSLMAIRRAAIRARQIAIMTNTDLIIMQDGQQLRIAPDMFCDTHSNQVIRDAEGFKPQVVVKQNF